MSKIKSIVAGSVLLGSHVGMAQTHVIPAKDLDKLNIDIHIVSDHFRTQTGVELNSSDVLKVSSENEGKNLRFETLDSISVVVPIEFARGSENKIGIEQTKDH